MTLDPEDSTIGGLAGFLGEDEVVWDDAAGWVGRPDYNNMTGTGISGTIRCHLDGVTRLLRYGPSAFGIGIFEQDELTDKVIASWATGSAELYLFNVQTGGLHPPNTLNSMAGAEMRTRYGWIRRSGATSVQLAPVDAVDETEYVTVHTLNPSPSAGVNDHWFLGPDGIAYYYTDNTNADIVIFDLERETELFPDELTTNRLSLDHRVWRCGYSRKLNVFVTVEEDGLTAGQGVLHVYSTELVPDALSAPTDTPSMFAGGISTISTTLTDDNGVGIPDRLIDWSITAGNGSLLDSQTRTNVNGIAITQYRAEITGGSNPTIQASLTY